MATTNMLPMNPGGSNQTSPGVSSGAAGGLPAAQPVFTPVTGGTTTSTNPYMSTVPTAPAVGTSNPNQANLNKQFTDILGKGVGGQEAQMFAGMGGTASQIFQQWQAGQLPVQAQEQAQLNAQLAGSGIGANSSVNAIAQSNLQSQFNAQAAAENAQLMTQNQQDQLAMLQGMQGLASQEVASSGWDVFGQVMQGLGGLAGQVMGLPTGSIGGSMIKGLFGGGGGASAPVATLPAGPMASGAAAA